MSKTPTKERADTVSTSKSGSVATGAPKPSDLEKKLAAIEKSKMPKWQKDQYANELKAKAGGKDTAKLISFEVYANIKKIPGHIRDGMKNYPPAKGTTSATFAAWEEVYKQF